MISHFLFRLESLTYIPDRFSHFLLCVAQQASSEVGGFDPEKVRDQFRVAFQASTVVKKRKRTHELKASKKRKIDASKASSSADPNGDNDDEGLRSETVFHDTLVEYEDFDV